MVDRFGHGTFAAAQVAGTGRAAGGERRGIAFGARLVIGKVLNDDGAGLDFTIIAGMQWAAARARVISMSLGGGPSDRTDPASLAVNRLTAAHHVLFVIAAGNSGPGDETVSSPAAATDALAVGAVGDQAVAGFGAVPASSTHPVRHELSWTNTGRTGLTATLSADLVNHAGRAAPAGALRLGAGKVRIGAGGSAAVTLSVNPRQ